MSARDLAIRVRVARELLAGRSEPQVYAGLGELHQLLLGPVIEAGGAQGGDAAAHRSSRVSCGAAVCRTVEPADRAIPGGGLCRHVPAGRRRLGDRGPATAVSTDHLTVFAPLPDSLPGTAREARSIVRLLPRSRMRLGRSLQRSRSAALPRGGRTGAPGLAWFTELPESALLTGGGGEAQRPGVRQRWLAGGARDPLACGPRPRWCFSRGVRPVLRRRDASRFRAG